ncbi:SMI1/KNR4 family protein SUKH-1 [Actinomycetospora succinea]|uniref:SMI1/KNR4 family protein SUKH-1 n=1 Tax=Actinomycetospora succinea TaxID=663603 RepID=A0A4R6VP57_9PSEU|nr:SMI1/KNR4 family protein [Actinomycetospora succinea]TDQ65682.1 SMI1/KNR4 family protein SUKH-1 [Actinomycetospora succinea]
MVDWVQDVLLPPATDADVRAHEDALRVDLPSDFLAVAQRLQGARPVPAAVGLTNGAGTAVARLLHFAEGFGNIVTRRFPVEEVLDKGVIPFAEDIGGDLFCFSYRTDFDAPPVVFWDVDGGAAPLAPTFTAFVDLLHE